MQTDLFTHAEQQAQKETIRQRTERLVADLEKQQIMEGLPRNLKALLSRKRTELAQLNA